MSESEYERGKREGKQELLDKIEDKFKEAIFKWGIEEGGDKLHFNEIVSEVIYKFKEKQEVNE